jgi:hypothetical protein
MNLVEAEGVKPSFRLCKSRVLSLDDAPMVATRGFEPPTRGTSHRRSTRLNYVAMFHTVFGCQGKQ